MKLKGFFLSLASLLLFIYVYQSVVVKQQAISELAEIYKERIKIASYESIYFPLSSDNVKELVKPMIHYALLKITNHTGLYPIKGRDEKEAMQNLKYAVNSLLENGSAKRELFENEEGIEYSFNEKSQFTIIGLREKLEELATENNLEVGEVEVKIKGISMASSDRIKVNLTVVIELNDRDNITSLKLNRTGEVKIDVNGLHDPLVESWLRERKINYSRIIYFSKKANQGIGEMAFLSMDANSCQGWMYGKLISTNRAGDIESSRRWLYLLVGSYEDIINTPGYEEFGGYVVTSEVDRDDEQPCGGDEVTVENGIFNPIVCDNERIDVGEERTDKPFIEILNFSIEDYKKTFKDLVTDSSNSTVLFFVCSSSPNDVLSDPRKKLPDYGNEIKIISIEDIRDSLACSYYYNASYYSIEAPNILQRMFKIRDNLKDQENGIFSFVLGSVYDEEKSVVDFEYVKGGMSSSVVCIKGAVGCKNPEMCEGESLAGRMCISKDIAKKLGLRELSCEDREGGCYE